MTHAEFKETVAMLERQAEELKQKSDNGDWYAELDYKKTMRQISEVQRTYYASLFK